MDGADAEEHSQQLKPHHCQDYSWQHSVQPLPFFSEGSVVEVQTDEEDFGGVSFLATIIPPSPATRSKKKSSKKTPKKLHVEYHNLLVREGRPERLREYVDTSFVKPAPPPQEDIKGFELNDSVDAFYKDGWWTGVVTRVLEGGRFIVTFQYPPDELEFGLADLRVHWDWCNGMWVRSEKQAIAASMYDVGKKVEVSFDSEDSQGAWFPATIEKILRRGIFLVEYGGLKNGNETESLKVTVDSFHIRPCPPFLKDKNYTLLEKVDSFINFCWWSGVITRVLEDCRYVVFFKQTNQMKEFHQSELRPHLEWKDGKWFASFSSQFFQDVLLQTSEIEKLSCDSSENAGGSTVFVAPVCCSGDNNDSLQSIPCLQTLSENQIEPLISSNQKSSHDTESLAERLHSSDTCNVLSQPLKKLEVGIMHGEGQHNTTDRSSEEFLLCSPVNDMPMIAPQPATRDQFSDNPSPGMMLRRLRKLGRKDYSSPRSLNKSRISTVQLERPGADVGGKERDEMGSAAEDVRNEHAEKVDKYTMIIGLPCPEMASEFGISRGKSGFRRSNCKEIISVQEKQSNCSATENMKNSKQLVTGEFSQKRKRGRPRKESSPHDPKTGNTLNGNVGSHLICQKNGDSHKTVEVARTNLESAFDENTDKLADGSDSKSRNRNMTKRTLPRIYNDKSKESIRLRKNPSSKRGRRFEHKDTLDASGGQKMRSNLSLEAVEKVATEAPCNEFDNEPLSKWIEGMQSPSVIKDSQVPPVSTMEQCVENSDNVCIGVSEKQKEGGVCPAFDDAGAIMPNEQQRLPFVKNTALWKIIDSMEVFKRMPQRPHFQPLIHLKETSREGLAVGYMVTFSTVVEKASTLRISDPKSITDDILDTLSDLEKHGFDVRAVEDRVNQMLAEKHKQEKLVEEKSKIYRQLSLHHLEKQKINEEIREMEQHLSKLQEKISLAASVREKEDIEIASLQSKLLKVDESIKSVESQFEELGASL